MTPLVVWEWVQLLWSVLQSYIALSVSHAYDEYTFQTSKNHHVPNVAEDSLLRYAEIKKVKISPFEFWAVLKNDIRFKGSETFNEHD